MPSSSPNAQDDIRALLWALVATLALLSGFGWLLLDQLQNHSASAVATQASLPPELSQRISQGERPLVPPSANRSPQSVQQLKQDGIAALAQQRYFEGIVNLEAALRDYPNDPEALIYLNNARIGHEPAWDVAVVVPISGSNPNNALEMLRGFAQVQMEVNAKGGIDGRSLRLILADDGDRPDIAQKLAHQFVQQPNILAVVGHWTSDVSLAAAPIYNAGKLPFITPISTTNQLSGVGPYIFRTALTNAQGGTVLAKYAVEQWQTEKVAIFYAAEVTYSEEIRQRFSQTLVQRGGEVVAQFDLSSPDFRPQRAVEESITAGAEVVLLATNNASVDRSLQVIQANEGRLKLMGDLANLYSPRTLDLGQDAAGLVMALSWSIDQPDADSFVGSSRRLWRADVNYATANAYDALNAVIAAMEGGSDRNRIAQRMAVGGFRSPSSRELVWFRASGDRVLTPQLVAVRREDCSRSGTGYDFVTIRRPPSRQDLNEPLLEQPCEK